MLAWPGFRNAWWQNVIRWQMTTILKIFQNRWCNKNVSNFLCWKFFCSVFSGQEVLWIRKWKCISCYLCGIMSLSKRFVWAFFCHGWGSTTLLSSKKNLFLPFQLSLHFKKNQFFLFFYFLDPRPRGLQYCGSRSERSVPEPVGRNYFEDLEREPKLLNYYWLY